MEDWRDFTKDSQWKTYLKVLLMTNEKSLEKAIMMIYNNQTREEKIVGKSVSHNAVGFNRWDSEEMSGIAEKIKRGEKLLPNEITHSKVIMPKYWKQIMNIVKYRHKIDQEAQIRAFEQLQAKQYEEIEKALKSCLEDNIPCSYGLCDECPNTLNYYRSVENE